MSTQKENYQFMFIGLVGAGLGIRAADIDLALPFLLHRSIVTHGLLFPVLACGFALYFHHARLRMFAIGLGVAMAVHFCFDLYPAAWAGYALIHIPGYGRASVTFSWAWLGVSAFIGLYGALWLVWRMRELVLSVISAAGAFFYYASHEKWLSPLMTFGVCLALTFAVSALFHLSPPEREIYGDQDETDQTSEDHGKPQPKEEPYP